MRLSTFCGLRRDQEQESNSPVEKSVKKKELLKNMKAYEYLTKLKIVSRVVYQARRTCLIIKRNLKNLVYTIPPD
jgi:hypothetical protein